MPKIAPVINYSPSRVMTAPMSRCLVVLSTLLLANCSFVNDAVWPSLANVPPEVKPGFQQQPLVAPVPPPPAPGNAEALATVTKVSGNVTGLGARLEQHRNRFTQLQNDLGAQSDTLTGEITAGRGGSSENWSQAQADLSRLNADVGTLSDLRDDVGADAAAAAGLVADLEPVTRSTLDDAAKQRLEAVRGAVDTVLAGLGSLDRDINTALTRWQGITSAQANSLNGVTPPGGSVAASEPPAQPAKPQLRKPKPKPAVDALVTGPRDSGDRFKGRQPLVTLSFQDPSLDFEPKLRGLIDKVRAQYPDIAFDIETIGAAPADLGKVRALLKAQDIPNDVFVTPPKAGAAPAIKLYPR